MSEQIALIYDAAAEYASLTGGNPLNIIGSAEIHAQWQADPDGFIHWLTANGWRVDPTPLPLIFDRLYVVWYKP